MDDQTTRKTLVYVFCAVLAAVVVASFIIIGSPEHNRQLNDDVEKENEINTLKYSVENYYHANCKLPAKLEDAHNYSILKYPLSTYHYEALENAKFRLCTNFYFANRNQTDYYPYSHYPRSHGSGYYCFDLQVYNESGKCKK